MTKTLLVCAIFSLVTVGCGLAAPDTQGTVAAQVSGTLTARPPEQVTVEVPVTQEVIVTQPVEVPVTVVVTEIPSATPETQETPAPADTQSPQATTPPVTNTGPGPDPLAGANVTPIIDERYDFPNKYYWWLFGPNYPTESVNFSASGEGKIENETYVMTSLETENYEWTFDGKKLQNFYATASTVIPDGQCKAGDHWGLVFRYKDNANFYLFGVSCDGKYSLLKRTADGFEDILPPTDSPAIKKLGQPNVLGVRAVGNQINLYANTQFLNTVTDGTFAEGLIGMYVRTLLTPKMGVVFDNITAYVVNP